MRTITFDESKFQLVPKEPTQEMLAAGCEAGLDISVLLDDTRYSTDRACYLAMLAKAPQL